MTKAYVEEGEDPPDHIERKDLRLELKVKNNALWHAIYDRYGSVSAFCRAFPHVVALRETEISELLRFKESPFRKDGSYRSICVAVEAALGILAEDLFPKRLYAVVTEPEMVVEVSSFTALPRAVQRKIARLPAPVEAPEVGAMRGELKKLLEKVLRTLTYREREIIKLRYGLGDGPTYTIEEVGRIFKTTRERVRQIEAKAIRKLQRPYQSGQLEDFLTLEG